MGVTHALYSQSTKKKISFLLELCTHAFHNATTYQVFVSLIFIHAPYLNSIPFLQCSLLIGLSHSKTLEVRKARHYSCLLMLKIINQIILKTAIQFTLYNSDFNANPCYPLLYFSRTIILGFYQGSFFQKKYYPVMVYFLISETELYSRTVLNIILLSINTIGYP